jgi:predicted transcriptional regulator
MDKLNISNLKQIFSALANEKRIKMVELCSGEGLTVTELSRALNLNYSITVEYTSMLEKVKLIKKDRNDDRTVTVKSLIELKNSGEIERI